MRNALTCTRMLFAQVYKEAAVATRKSVIQRELFDTHSTSVANALLVLNLLHMPDNIVELMDAVDEAMAVDNPDEAAVQKAENVLRTALLCNGGMPGCPSHNCVSLLKSC